MNNLPIKKNRFQVNTWDLRKVTTAKFPGVAVEIVM